MRKLIAFLLLLPAIAAAELLPEALGRIRAQESSRPYQPAEPEIFQEFGFEQGEKARYVAPDGAAVEITANRFAEDTGAFSAFQWKQPHERQTGGV